jgi:hypothetical protein
MAKTISQHAAQTVFGGPHTNESAMSLGNPRNSQATASPLRYRMCRRHLRRFSWWR